MSVFVKETDVSALCTAGCGGVVKQAFYPASIDDLVETAKATEGADVTILGGVSNVLLLDGYDGAAVFSTKLNAVRFDGATVTAQGGANLSRLVKDACRRGLGGLEALCGVCGTVGGAISGNAGCFGAEICENLRSVTVFRLDDGETEELSQDEIAFSYRHCNLRKNRDFILDATFELYEEDAGALEDRLREYRKKRAQSTPRGKSLGCFFKRYRGVSAGYYIEQAGAKGLRLGGVTVSEKHADFFLNAGGSAADYLALSEVVRKQVWNHSGVWLEREVIVVGEERQRARESGTL